MRYERLGAAGYLGQFILLVAVGVVSYIAVATPNSLVSFFSSIPWPSGLGGALLLEVILLVPTALVSVAWLLSGRSEGSGVLMATGIVGILYAAGALIYTASVWTTFLAGVTSGPTSSAVGEITGALSLYMLTTLFSILQIVTLFISDRLFLERWFGYAGWGSVASIAVAFGVVIVAVDWFYTSLSSISSQGSTPSYGFLGPLFALMFIALAVPQFLAFRAFRSLAQGAPVPASTAAKTP